MEEFVENNQDIQNKKSKKKNKKGKIIGIIFLVLLLIGVVTCGVLWKLGIIGKTEKVVSTPKQKYAYQMQGNDLQDFDLSFLKIENEEKNKIYSPLSIKYALAMLKEGANGETKKQITDVIGKYSSKKYENSENMSLANAMFIKDSYKENVKKEYSNKLKTKYNAEVIYDSFQTAATINNWTKDKTFGLIDKLFDDTISENDYILVNALAIDMEWNNQIHCSVNHTVPCLVENYSIYYPHETIYEAGEDRGYTATSMIYMRGEESFYQDQNPYINKENRSFNGQEMNYKASEVLADFNRYDIIKELGEDKIRAIVKPKYEAWLKTDEGQNMSTEEFYMDRYPTDPDKYLDKYIEEIKTNYNKQSVNTDFYLYEDDDVKSFAKDLKTYNGTTLQYVGIMPKKEKLADYVKDIKAKDVNKTIQNLKEVKLDNFEEGYATRIRGLVPLFKFDYELKLLEDLQSMGIKDVFNQSKADLSKMTSAKSFINKAVHKANIDFSNDGIKAAAATGMGGAGGTNGGFDYSFKIPSKEIDITFDNPYMFIIRDKSTGEVWFAGTVYEPTHK